MKTIVFKEEVMEALKNEYNRKGREAGWPPDFGLKLAWIEKAVNSADYWLLNWIPVEYETPPVDEDGYSEKMLVSFDKCSVVDICEYRVKDGAGKWYIGDMDDSPEDIGLKVVAWMYLPESYGKVKENEESVDEIVRRQADMASAFMDGMRAGLEAGKAESEGEDEDA